MFLPLIQKQGGNIPNPPPQIRPFLPSHAIYVEESWGRPLTPSEEDIWGPSVEVFPGDEQSMVTIDAQRRSIAFAQGYYVDVGQTRPQGVGVPKYIILAFGNQDKINNEQNFFLTGQLVAQVCSNGWWDFEINTFFYW
ncbi:MAG: hypothetical protein HC914_05495 [Chloroflexaceae bacterium]|nr:hypothetical protein [Chloroflexaceae bacterium]